MFPPSTSSSVFAGKLEKFQRSLTVFKAPSCWSKPHTFGTLNVRDHDLICCGECASGVKKASLQPWCITLSDKEKRGGGKLHIPQTLSWFIIICLSLMYSSASYFSHSAHAFRKKTHSWCGTTHTCLWKSGWANAGKKRVSLDLFSLFPPVLCVLKVNCQRWRDSFAARGWQWQVCGVFISIWI